MDANELERTLVRILDALALTPKLARAARAAGMGRTFVHEAIKRSEAGDERYLVQWGGGNFRQFAELVPLAQRIGQVKREQYLRGVTINGAVQYVRDPWLLARFGEDDDSQAMAELEGFPQYPFALDAGGNKIPLLSARHPRPQRQHTPHPHTGRNGTFGKPNSPPRVKPEREWRPDDPLPPYAREVYTRTPPPIVNIPTPATPRVRADSPLVADLLRHLERPPLHPRPTMPVRLNGARADDPPEYVTGQERQMP